MAHAEMGRGHVSVSGEHGAPACDTAERPHDGPLQVPSPAPESSTARADAALERALDYLAGLEANPHLLLSLDLFHRRFGYERFRDSLARYDEVMAHAPPDAALELRALRRMLDPNNAMGPEDRSPCVPTVDRLTCPALYCDRLPAPPAYAMMLRGSVETGRYLLTHVGLTMMLARDLGCTGLVPADVQTATISGMTKLVARDGRVTDLELEAATFLTYLGYGDHVAEGFTEDVLAGQRPSGGWALDSASPQQPDSWHATCNAAWYLLESRPASGVRPPMGPRR